MKSVLNKRKMCDIGKYGNNLIGSLGLYFKISQDFSNKSSDERYIDAIKNGNIDEAQRLVNEAGEEAIEKEFDRHYTGFIDENAYSDYNKPGGLSWLGGPEKNPVLLMEKDGIEYRQSGEKLQYTFYDDKTFTHRRDENGDLIFKTDDEIKSEGLPLYSTDITAYANGKPIGTASNEFGAVGVWVEPQYQGKGIGTTLLDLHMKQRGSKTRIGQMTNAGINMTKSWLRKKQDRSPVIYDESGNVVPLSRRFDNNHYETTRKKGE